MSLACLFESERRRPHPIGGVSCLRSLRITQDLCENCGEGLVTIAFRGTHRTALSLFISTGSQTRGVWRELAVHLRSSHSSTIRWSDRRSIGRDTLANRCATGLASPSIDIPRGFRKTCSSAASCLEISDASVAAFAFDCPLHAGSMTNRRNERALPGRRGRPRLVPGEHPLPGSLSREDQLPGISEPRGR